MLELNFTNPADRFEPYTNRFQNPGTVRSIYGDRVSPFSKKICKFFNQRVLGLQSSKDIKLSNGAGTLDEPVLLKKTAGRLSRNLKEEDSGETLNEIIAAEGASKR